MPNALQPKLTGREVTVDFLLKTPTNLAAQIGKLADEQLLLPVFCHQNGTLVQGGGMLFTTVTAANWYAATDVEQRGPGDEYPLTSVVDPTPHLAAVEDWGSKIRVPDEVVLRNNTSYLEWAVLSSATPSPADRPAAHGEGEAMADLGGAGTVPGHDWSNLIMVGPGSRLDPKPRITVRGHRRRSARCGHGRTRRQDRPLVVHPTEAYSLRWATPARSTTC